MHLKFLNPLRWKKSFLGILLSGFVLVWFVFMDTYSLQTRWELNNQKEELKERTEQLNKKAEELRVKISKLNSDPALLEKIAREEYGMHKPGETVYKVKREK